MLALTFTNQAAAELRARIDVALADRDGPRPMVATFHGFGRFVLETVFSRSVEIADDVTRSALMAEAMAGTTAHRKIEKMLDAVSLVKQSTAPASAIEDAEVRAAYQRYQSLLVSRKLLDLDDLVLTPYLLLDGDAAAAAALASRFDSISVDEYQDVNDVQAALVRLLSPAGRNLLVIGDPDQAIYGFRGARPGHFTRFRQAFPHAREVQLDTTYRLPAPILRTAQSVLGSARGLVSLKPGAKVELVACPSEDAEAEQLLVRIERLLGGSSHFAVNSGRGGDAEEPDIGFGDIAVLCRLKLQREAILDALSRSAIPCLLVGEDEPHDPRSEKVAIMTMHASKGREFEVVFIVGVEPCLVPLELDGLTSDVEEERRLLYVAATRAKRRLIVSHTRQRVMYGRRLPGGPSPFLANLPKEVVERCAVPSRPTAKSRQLPLF